MQLKQLITALVPALLLWSASAQSTLKYAEDKPAFTFDYTTSSPSTSNWVAIYPKGADPANASDKGKYIVWRYAPYQKGTVQLPPGSMLPGEYTAWFLANNGYNKLAGPTKAVFRGDEGPVQFIVDEFTTQNARERDAFSARVGGLLKARATPPAFRLITDTSRSGWVRVASDGLISGTPAKGDRGETTVIVGVTAENLSNATLQVTIPIVPFYAPLVDKLKVTTMNLWIGGKYVDDSHVKQVKYLVSTNSDVIAFQETIAPGDAGTRLAKALGYFHQDKGDMAIVSRYPISETVDAGDNAAMATRIQLDGPESQIVVFTVHLGYTPYGPYDFCRSNMTPEQVLQREAQSGRTPQITAITAQVKKYMDNADKVPVFLTGDFNAPSQLDWTDATKDQHCGVGYFEWPTSKLPLDAGLIDTFRYINPNPAREPGDTWSPVNPAPAEPQDRIDFIYHGGNGVKALTAIANMVGTPKPNPDVRGNEWTTDHKSVEALYDVLPIAQRPRKCVPKPKHKL